MNQKKVTHTLIESVVYMCELLRACLLEYHARTPHIHATDAELLIQVVMGLLSQVLHMSAYQHSSQVNQVTVVRVLDLQKTEENDLSNGHIEPI